MSDDAPETLRAENERLRADNERLRAEVERLRAELYRAGRYLPEPKPGAARGEAGPAEINWAYQRDDLEDELGDD